MKIYPQKPQVKPVDNEPNQSEAYAKCQAFAKGEISFETACAELEISAGKFQQYLSQFKAYVDDINKKMSESKSKTLASLKTDVKVDSELFDKNAVIDELINRASVKGDYEEYKKTLNNELNV